MALDNFKPPGPHCDHYCLVQKPMWESWKDLLRRNPSGRFTEDVLKVELKYLFLALDYLHSECKVVHTAFTHAELTAPSARKYVGDAVVYESRSFDLPRRFGLPVLSDFGAAVRGDVRRNHDAQPAVYRWPEVMLGTEWTYPVDIWNVGVMAGLAQLICPAPSRIEAHARRQIWDLIAGEHLFSGEDPEYHEYRTRAHLAEVISLLGMPPPDLLHRGRRTREFFDENGTWIADVPIPSGMSLERCDEFLEGVDKEGFLYLMRSMLQWKPEHRKTAKQLFQDPWLNS